MTKAAIFYERAVAVSAEEHREWCLDASAGFGFAREANFVPIATPEFEKAAWHYPIVFVHEGDAVLPCVILSYVQGENLFVDADGHWDAEYVPAYVRRYPFIFASTPAREALTLCIDDGYQGFNQENRGERLFLVGGGRSAFLERSLEFLQEFQAQQARTAELSRRLVELDVLEPAQAQVSLRSGEQLSLGGFSTVNRERLRGLQPDDLSALARDDWLELIHIHLFSLANFAALMDRHAGKRVAP